MSDEKGQNTAPATPPFPVASSFSYGPVTPTEIKVKNVSGQTIDIDPKTAVSGAGSPGTFKVQPLTPKSVTYKPNYVSTPKIPVGGEVKRGPSTADLEAMRLKAELHAELTKIGLDLKDMVHEAGELKKKKLKPETLAFLESAEEKVNDAFAEAYGEPDSEKLALISEFKAEFVEAIEKAGAEAAVLPPETDQEKELLQSISKLSGKILKLAQHGRALEDNIASPDFLKTFKAQREDLERTLVELTDNPDETKKGKLEEDAVHYEGSIESAEKFIQQNPKPAVAASPSTQNIFDRMNDYWKMGNLHKFKDKQKEASFAFNKYVKFLDKVKKAKRLDIAKEIIEEKLAIQQEIRDIDPNSKEKYLPFDLSGMLKTFSDHIDVKEGELEKELEKAGTQKKVEDARKGLVKKIEELPKDEYKKQIGRISDAGATDLTVDYLKKHVGEFASQAKKLGAASENLKLDELESASKQLDEKKAKVEKVLSDEEKKRLIINKGLVLRPFKLTNRTRDMVFSNGKTGQQIHNEQETTRAYTEKIREAQQNIDNKRIPEDRKRYAKAFESAIDEVVERKEKQYKKEEKKKEIPDDKAKELRQDAFEEVAKKYIDARGTKEDRNYTMTKELLEHPYKKVVADVLSDPNNKYHAEGLREPDAKDKLADKLLETYGPIPEEPKPEEPKPETSTKEKIRAVTELMKTLGPRLGIIAASTILVTVIASKLTEGETPQNPEARVESLEKKDWKISFKEELAKKDPRFMEFAELPNDLPNKTPEELMKKYVPTFFTRESSPARVKMALGMWGNLVQNDNTVHYTNLLPEERKKFSDFRTVLGIISLLTSGEDLKKDTNFEQEIMDVKQKAAQKDL